MSDAKRRAFSLRHYGHMIASIVSLAVAQSGPFAGWPDSQLVGDNPRETHLRNLRKLTFGGQNAEAYWNYEGTQIVFQSSQPAWPDEQIVVMNADGSGRRMISTGKGRCTCGYFTRDGRSIYFSSTHEKNEGPQSKLDFSKGYVWMVNPQFSMYRVNADGSGLTKVLDRNAYVAETTISPTKGELFFTSDFEGDLQIYRANLDGSGIRRLTNEEGYDGGPFVSWDGKKVVYRRAPLDTPEKVAEYRALLAQHLVRPGWLEIWIMDADGRNKRQVTHLGAASFAPFLHPNGRSIIFSSNFGDKHGREFELWMINVDGTGLKRITYSAEFDGFPMFTRDGKRLVWASNRHGSVPGETNIFVADWRD